MRIVDSDITLRPATAVDTAVARAIHHRAVRDLVLRQFGTWDELQQDEFFDDDWNHAQFEMIELAGRVCGYFRCERLPTHVVIHEINVDPEFQGQRIGTRVLLDALSDADKLNLPVELQTLHLNRAASLYRRLGFRETGKTATHTRMRRPGAGETPEVHPSES